MMFFLRSLILVMLFTYDKSLVLSISDVDCLLIGVRMQCYKTLKKIELFISIFSPKVAKVFSAQFTVISVSGKVYFGKF